MIYGFTHFCCQIVIYYSLIILEYLEYIILLLLHQQRQPLALLILLVELRLVLIVLCLSINNQKSHITNRYHNILFNNHRK